MHLLRFPYSKHRDKVRPSKEDFMRNRMLMTAALLAVAASPVLAQTGNGAPNGAHYELGIIGVSDPKTQPLTGSDRHTIFVGLGANKEGGDVITNIYLTQGPFAVCDRNGLDLAYACDGSPRP
jgi:hypothetical protein